MIETSEQAFVVNGGALTVDDGQNTSLLAIFNTADSSFLLRVYRVLLMSGSLSAVTGVGIDVRVRRLGALVVGAGSAVPLLALNREHAKGEVLTHVTAFKGGTATAFDTLAYRAVNNDEVSLTGQADIVEREIWRAPDPRFPVVLPSGQGLDIFQGTNSTVGGWIPEIHFTVQRRKG